MPPRRYRRNRRARKGRKMMRRTRPRYYTVTETVGTDLSGNSLYVQAGGFTLGMNAAAISQFSTYAKLYKQYRITRIQAMLVPEFNTFDGNTAIQNQLGTSVSPWSGDARLTWAINNSADLGTPTSELQVLNCNGSKVAQLNKIWRCAFRPVPSLGAPAPLAPVAVSRRN